MPVKQAVDYISDGVMSQQEKAWIPQIIPNTTIYVYISRTFASMARELQKKKYRARSRGLCLELSLYSMGLVILEICWFAENPR